MAHRKSKDIIGFFSLSASNISTFDSYIREIVQLGGAIRIDMFAIDLRYQHKKEVDIRDTDSPGAEHLITYGHLMLNLCIEYIQTLAGQFIGASFITLFSTREGERLYHEIGRFDAITDDDNDLVILRDESEEADSTIPMYRDIFLND